MNKAIITMLFLSTFSPFSNADVGDLTITMIVPPKERLSTRWAFVIDGSSSLWYDSGQSTCKLLAKSELAFKTATANPSDELMFCAYLFGDENKHKYKKWQPGNPEVFTEMINWLRKGAGLFSFGNKPMGLALHEKVKNLTIILITDGGFTSACNRKGFNTIKSTIENGQTWRKENGYNEAIICVIGIENKHYFGGGKPLDDVCQKFLKKIGTKYNGGYWSVSTKHPPKDEPGNGEDE